MTRPVVLMLLGALWPGHEANGPNQSLLGLCRALAESFDFAVIARDRGKAPGAEALARAGEWAERDFARVLYLEAHGRKVEGLGKALRETPHDLLVFNSFFDPELTIPTLAMRRLGLLSRGPAILSPRGEFSPGALGIKPLRKHCYIGLARAAGLLHGVTLHATSERERDEITAVLPGVRDIAVAANVRVLEPAPPSPPPRESGPLRLLFLSRIDRKKNLDYALRVLGRVSTPVTYDIYGPISDADYWSECQALIAELPPHVSARYCGQLPHGRVHAVFGGYDALLLPTRGENFGHSIVDALAAACPVLISDQTPWLGLDRAGAGWSLPLGDPQGFSAAIETLGGLPEAELLRLRDGARAFAERIVRDGDAVSATRAMFLQALARREHVSA